MLSLQCVYFVYLSALENYPHHWFAESLPPFFISAKQVYANKSSSKAGSEKGAGKAYNSKKCK